MIIFNYGAILDNTLIDTTFLDGTSINPNDDTNNIGSSRSILALRSLIDLLMIEYNGSFCDGDPSDVGSNKSDGTFRNGESVDNSSLKAVRFFTSIPFVWWQ